jgi:hypothetical protein
MHYGRDSAGTVLRNALPDHHLSSDAKDVVRLGTGLIGTLAALVIGLLISTAKTSYDTQHTQVKQLTANVILLDYFLEEYGDDARPLRELMRHGIGAVVDRIWRQGRSHAAAPFEAAREGEAFFLRVQQQLSPKNEMQRSLYTRAEQALTDLAKTRLALFTQQNDPIPMPLGRAGILAHLHLHELHPVCVSEPDGDHRPGAVCPLGQRRDLPDTGAGPPL